MSRPSDRSGVTLSRRQCLGGLTAGLAAGTLSSLADLPAGEPPAKPNPICAFTKPFQSLSFEELAKSIARLGYDGIEGTIRRGGHIVPEEAPEKLPRLVEALRKEGLELTVMATSINRVNRVNEAQLRAAAALGIRHYRTQYYMYDLERPLIPQIEGFRKQARELAALNAELGITGCIQNHAGARYVGAPLWDLEILLEDIDPRHLGVAFDIRHATVEGGTTWKTHLALLRPRIQAIFVKDFRWVDGQRKPVNIPLGAEGARVDPEFFEILARSDFKGPISLHEEYLDHRDPALVPEHLEAMGRDLRTLKGWLKS